MDIEALLGPVSADEPAGPDLSYDPSRQLIEEAFSSDPDEVDWARTIALIEAEAERTRDVWLAVYLTRAGARAGELDAVVGGTAMLAGLFEQLWDSAHPSLEEYGIQGRKGACESLVRIGEFLGPLRQMPLVSHPRLGSFSGADFERFTDGGADEAGYGQFRAALADLSTERLAEAVGSLRQIEDAIRRADDVMSMQASAAGQTGTNFQPTYDAIDALVRAVAVYAGEAVVAGASVDEDGAEPDRSVSAAADTPGRINSRADVGRALDAIIGYYARAEPSSPVPVALERVKSWLTLDFLQILEDISPGGLSEAQGVLRGRASRDDSSDMM